jgi:hypothetical protein
METLTNQRITTHPGTQAGKLKPTDYKGKIQNKISQTHCKGVVVGTVREVRLMKGSEIGGLVCL